MNKLALKKELIQTLRSRLRPEKNLTKSGLIFIVEECIDRVFDKESNQ